MVNEAPPPPQVLVVEDGTVMDRSLPKLIRHYGPEGSDARWVVASLAHVEAERLTPEVFRHLETVFLDALDVNGRGWDRRRSQLASLTVLDRFRDLARTTGHRPKVAVYSVEMQLPRVAVPFADYDDVVTAMFGARDLLDATTVAEVLAARRPAGTRVVGPADFAALGLATGANLGRAHQRMMERPDAWDLVVARQFPPVLTPPEPTRKWIRRNVCPLLGINRYAHAVRIIRHLAIDAPLDD